MSAVNGVADGRREGGGAINQYPVVMYTRVYMWSVGEGGGEGRMYIYTGRTGRLCIKGCAVAARVDVCRRRWPGFSTRVHIRIY